MGDADQLSLGRSPSVLSRRSVFHERLQAANSRPRIRFEELRTSANRLSDKVNFARGFWQCRAPIRGKDGRGPPCHKSSRCCGIMLPVREFIGCRSFVRLPFAVSVTSVSLTWDHEQRQTARVRQDRPGNPRGRRVGARPAFASWAATQRSAQARRSASYHGRVPRSHLCQTRQATEVNQLDGVTATFSSRGKCP